MLQSVCDPAEWSSPSRHLNCRIISFCCFSSFFISFEYYWLLQINSQLARRLWQVLLTRAFPVMYRSLQIPIRSLSLSPFFQDENGLGTVASSAVASTSGSSSIVVYVSVHSLHPRLLLATTSIFPKAPSPYLPSPQNTTPTSYLSTTKTPSVPPSSFPLSSHHHHTYPPQTQKKIPGSALYHPTGRKTGTLKSRWKMGMRVTVPCSLSLGVPVPRGSCPCSYPALGPHRPSVPVPKTEGIDVCYVLL